MFRGEVQNKTGLTRKAIEYYEEKGFINPTKDSSGYRDYSDNDVEILLKISIYRKLGLSVAETFEIIKGNKNHLSSILRKKEYKLSLENRRKELLEHFIKENSFDRILNEIKALEKEETIYERLDNVFPGYFGQAFFAAYKPFFDNDISADEEAYNEFIKYLDGLPNINFSSGEISYIEEMTKNINNDNFAEINSSKITAVNSYEKWFKDNEDIINRYKEFKESSEYLNSPMKSIQDKLTEYLLNNNYYEIAIPLIRKFCKSYDEYYIKLQKANDYYLDRNN